MFPWSRISVYSRNRNWQSFSREMSIRLKFDFRSPEKQFIFFLANVNLPFTFDIRMKFQIHVSMQISYQYGTRLESSSQYICYFEELPRKKCEGWLGGRGLLASFPPSFRYHVFLPSYRKAVKSSWCQREGGRHGDRRHHRRTEFATLRFWIVMFL